MSSPSVSIVITVKNEEENIGNLLDSIKELNYQGQIETVIVDGGSTDETPNIISKYSFVKLFIQRSNISEGRNIGLRNSTGEIIAFTDGDCILKKNWITNIIKHFLRDPVIGVVGGPYIPANQSGIFAKYIALYVNSYFPSTSSFTSHTRIGTGNAAYRREVIENVGGFNNHLEIGEDIDLNLRISKTGYKLYFADDVRVFHRYRTSIMEASKWAFIHGKADSLTRKAGGNSLKLLFPYYRTFLMLLVSLFLAYFLSGNIILLHLGESLFLLFYIYKLYSFSQVPYKPEMSLRERIVLPMIDLYIRSLESIGSLIGLFS